jgi:hypothetical protein
MNAPFADWLKMKVKFLNGVAGLTAQAAVRGPARLAVRAREGAGEPAALGRARVVGIAPGVCPKGVLFSMPRLSSSHGHRPAVSSSLNLSAPSPA